jgi:glutamate-1-semialdehyde 2,1-aminomutase
MKEERTTLSWQLFDRATKVIPLATQTHAKAAHPELRGIEPCFISRGLGCRVWDVDGNEYLDLRNSLGPITLGHRFAPVEQAVREQLVNGTIFSYAHPLEVEVAELLVQAVPCAQMVRFLRTGGEAMAAVIRLARAYTGRDFVLMCGYHGWLNSVFRPGVPEAIQSVYAELPWGDIEPYQQVFKQQAGKVAAVTVACDYAQIEKGKIFLRQLRELTQQNQALLIFDEIVTGFRLAIGGAQEYFGITPDMAVFAKGISNGFPLSCYLGRRDIMQTVERSVVSSTFGGDTLGLAAAKAVLETYQRENVIETIWQRGKQLHRGFADICSQLGVPAGFFGLPPLGALKFVHEDDDRNSKLFLRFYVEALKRGVIIYNVCYPIYAHTEKDIDDILIVFEAAMKTMREEGLFD